MTIPGTLGHRPQVAGHRQQEEGFQGLRREGRRAALRPHQARPQGMVRVRKQARAPGREEGVHQAGPVRGGRR